MSLLLEWLSVPNVGFKWLLKWEKDQSNRMIIEQGIGRPLSASFC